MLLGKDHPSTLTSINNLALVLRSHGKYELIQEQSRELYSLHGVVKNRKREMRKATNNDCIAT